MKRIFISIITILTILLLLSSFAYASNYIRPTLSEVKVLLEASTDYKSISMLNNKTLQITDEIEDSKKTITVNLYYDNSKDIFYTEEVFDNTMDNDTMVSKYLLLFELPINAFLTVAEKNNVDSTVSTTYTLEKSMGPYNYSTMALLEMLEASPTDKVTSLDTLIDKEFEDNTNIDCEYFTTKLEKTTTASNITLRYTLTIKTDADFSKMADYSENLKEQQKNLENARNNADYKIKLQPGETYVVTLDGKEARDFSVNWNSCIDISMAGLDGFIFTAKKEGEGYGTLTFADGIDDNGNFIGKVEKTYYVKVSKTNISLNTNTLNTNIINNIDKNNTLTTNSLVVNKNNTINSNTNKETIYNSTITTNKTTSVTPSTNVPNTNTPRNSVVNMPSNSVVNELPDAGINSSAITIIKILLSLAILALIIFTGYNFSKKNDN